MKKLEIIIRPEKLEQVRHALEDIGASGMTITEAEGHGNQKGMVQQWRGEKYKVTLLPKIKIEIIVNDDHLETAISAITRAAKTGEIGDGKIFVYQCDEVIKIRTGERGPKAV